MGEKLLTTLPQALSDERLREGFLTLYILLFNSEWGEVWTPKAAGKKFDELARTDREPARLYLEHHREGPRTVVEGICLGYTGSFHEVTEARELPPDCPADSSVAELRAAFVRMGVNEEERLLAVRELGIRPSSRLTGAAAIQKIMSLALPVFRNGQESGASHAWFWTARGTKFFKIAVGFGFREACLIPGPREIVAFCTPIDWCVRALAREDIDSVMREMLERTRALDPSLA